MAFHLCLNPDNIKFLRKIDQQLMSFNIEITEVTGGTFWKSYTPGQVAGTEPFQPLQVKELTDVAGYG